MTVLTKDVRAAARLEGRRKRERAVAAAARAAEAEAEAVPAARRPALPPGAARGLGILLDRISAAAGMLARPGLGARTVRFWLEEMKEARAEVVELAARLAVGK